MFCHNNKAFFFFLPKDAAGAALKKAALGSGQQNIGSDSTLKVAAPAPQHCIQLHQLFGQIFDFNINQISGYTNYSDSYLTLTLTRYQVTPIIG